MKNHRIIKKTHADGRVYYKVQERILIIFWAYVQRDFFFHNRLSLINSLAGNTNHPANLVGKTHESYLDALEEVAYHEQCETSRKVKKKEVINLV